MTWNPPALFLLGFFFQPLLHVFHRVYCLISQLNIINHFSHIFFLFVFYKLLFNFIKFMLFVSLHGHHQIMDLEFEFKWNCVFIFNLLFFFLPLLFINCILLYLSVFSSSFSVTLFLSNFIYKSMLFTILSRTTIILI